jgi:hypothetical protein
MKGPHGPHSAATPCCSRPPSLPPPAATQDFANTLQALALLRHRPDRRWLDALLSESLAALPSFQPQELACSLAAFSALRYRPSDAWLHAALAHSQDLLLAGRLGPAQLARLIWSLAWLDLQPEAAWMVAYLEAAGLAMEGFSGQELARMLYALAKLSCQPSRAWLDVCALQLQAQLGDMAVAEVVMAARALAQMRAAGQPHAGLRGALASELYSLAGLMLLVPRWALQGQRLPAGLAARLPLLQPRAGAAPQLVDRG